MIPAWQLALAGAIAVSIGAGVAIAIEEILWMRRRGRFTRTAWREMLMSLSALPPTVIVSLALSGWWLFFYAEAARFAVASIDSSLLILVPAILLADLCYYLEHRAAHGTRWLWLLYHAAHHSSPHYTVATAYRVSFVNQFFAPVFYLPCVLAGFEPMLVVALQVFTIHYQAWVHTRVIGRLPWLDKFFNTPANHRMHHDLGMSGQGVNFGAILMVWDHMFGTYRAPRRVRAFGIAGAPVPGRWHEIYTAPFAARRAGRD